MWNTTGKYRMLLHQLLLLFVIALGIMTIVASGGGGSGGSNKNDTGSDVEQVKTPVFSPSSGTYNADQNIIISTTTSGADIYYTTDNSNPTTNSTKYSIPIPVNGNGTNIIIKAIAVKSGMENSDISTGAFIISYSQILEGEWTWVSGSNSPNASGVYGTKGVGSTSNTPGARNECVSWRDSEGNLWLFGGSGNDKSGNVDDLNDLWKYNILTGEWTWVSGSDTVHQLGEYGSKGIGSVSNVPGARCSSVSWIDSSGNLWLFGGWGWDISDSWGPFNDLWKFDPSTGEWTWISGSDTVYQVGVYGTKGAGNTSNTPGSRANSASWIDSNGNLWLFGGSSAGEFNDLWKFDPSTREWTWISGNNTVDQTGVYGTKGAGSTSNMPGARAASSLWKDSDGNIWLFGGFGHGATADESGDLNDLWKLDPLTGEWTWISGSNNVIQIGIYGTKGVGSTSNMPGARYSCEVWLDPSGNLWLFGGIGWDAYGNNDILGDLWKFDPSVGEWTWVSGDDAIDQIIVYGTKGVGNASYTPGARNSAVSWTDSAGNLWLFGGAHYDNIGYSAILNDIWKFEP
jgi:N-acetylneuraminic acid mutarotase